MLLIIGTYLSSKLPYSILLFAKLEPEHLIFFFVQLHIYIFALQFLNLVSVSIAKVRLCVQIVHIFYVYYSYCLNYLYPMINHKRVAAVMVVYFVIHKINLFAALHVSLVMSESM